MSSEDTTESKHTASCYLGIEPEQCQPGRPASSSPCWENLSDEATSTLTSYIFNGTEKLSNVAGAQASICRNQQISFNAPFNATWN